MNANRLMIGFFATLMLVALTSFPMPVSAHSPSGVEIDYDAETNTLSVDVYHTVSDPNSHYIEEIEVYLNDVLEIERTYTSQESTSSMSDTFIIEATDGDVIEVEAYCNQFGSFENTLTIGNEETTTTDGNGVLYTPLNEILLATSIVLPLTIIILIWIRRRSQQ